jgi:superfamily II DNA or RNA helicase
MDLFSSGQAVPKILRYYQTEAVEAILKDHAEGENGLAIMATGTGKTVVAAELIRQWVDKKSPTLMVAHTEELVNQAIAKIRDHAGYAPEKEMAGDWAENGKLVVVGSVPSMQRARLERWPAHYFKQFIVDEAHHSTARTYKNMINHFNQAHLLGLTATPDRADSKQLGNIYSKVSYEYPLHRAIKDGYLVRIVGRRCKDFTIDLSELKIVAGDYQDNDLADVIDRYVAPIAQNIKNETENLKTLCFLPNVESSRLMAEELKKVGLKAGYVSGAMDKHERRHTLYQFKQGNIMHLCCCNVLLEGFDEPSIQAIVMARPTGSRTVYSQAVGRGTRLFDRKDELLLVEFTFNSDKLKLVTAYELFSTMGFGEEVQKAAKKKADGEEEVDFLSSLEDAHKNVYDPLNVVKRIAVPNWGFVSFDPLELGKLVNIDMSGEFDIHYNGRKLEGGITDKQKELLTRYGVEIKNTMSKAQASALISAFMQRNIAPSYGFASDAQIKLLGRLGYNVEPGTNIKKAQASFLIQELMEARKQK